MGTPAAFFYRMTDCWENPGTDLLNRKVDYCALGNGAGCGFDRDCGCSSRSGWRNDITAAGTACEESGADEEDAEEPGDSNGVARVG